MAKRERKTEKPVKAWAITWLLAIFAAKLGLIPRPEMTGFGLPFWIPIGMDVLRFIVLWFAAHIITQIIFGIWDILNEYYQMRSGR
ncbi:MAG: hypothetical protein WCY67_07920 [Acidithiobacillus sp.]